MPASGAIYSAARGGIEGGGVALCYAIKIYIFSWSTKAAGRTRKLLIEQVREGAEEG